MDYEQALSNISFYKIHPELKPFIGKEYEAYQILIVGESHYLDKKSDGQKYSLDYFATHWWDGNCKELEENKDAYDTRGVIKWYLEGYRGRWSSIFTNVVKSFSKIVLNQSIDYINIEESQKFNYFSFMNFFQMPSIIEGKSFWNSLYENNPKEEADALWKKTSEVSSSVLDSVIEIIKPKLIIFVSTSAYDAYCNSNAKHKYDKNVVHVCHPGCAWWYRKKKNGKCGKDDFEDILKHIVGC